MMPLASTQVITPEDIQKETGCQVYDTYWLCPQTIVLENIPLKYTTNLVCYELDNESYGCYGNAILLSDAHYQECQIYIPLLAGNEVDYTKMQYNYNCHDRKWKSGSTVELLTYPDLLNGIDCHTTESNDSYSEKACKAKGQAIVANATIDEENGTKYLIVMSSKPQTGIIPNLQNGIVLETWQWVAIALFVLVLVWMYLKRRK